MGFESVDIFVNDTTPLAKPVAGVTVRVFSQDGKIPFTQSVTDASGHAGFLLPSGSIYQLRTYKFQVGFCSPQFFQVLPSPLAPGQTNAFNISAILLTPPVPTDSRLCTAFGYFRDITGAPQASVELQFIAEFDPIWLDGAAVVKERVIIRTDEHGYAQLNLIRCGKYGVTVAGEEDVVRHIAVPNAPNVNLPDLLFPIVSQVVLTPPGPFTVQAGMEMAVSMHVFASDGEDLGLAFGDILVSTSDNNILSYAFSPGGLTLIGIAPGQAQINIVRSDQSIVHIPDPGVQGQPIIVTVTP